MYESTPLKLIETVDELKAACKTFASAKQIAVDLEGDSLFHYQERIALIQVSVVGTDYIIDPLKIEDLSSFLELLADSKLLKVMHGSDYDIISIKRDYGVQIKGLFDTQIAAHLLGTEHLGLAALVDQYFVIELDKKYQKHNWSIRPLEQAHINYARGDTHWLLALKEILVHNLKKEGLLEALYEEVEDLCAKPWFDRKNTEDAFMRIKHANTLSDEGKVILRNIWELREGLAKERDLPSFKIFSNVQILKIAQLVKGNKTPSNKEILSILGNRNYARYGKSVLKRYELALSDERPLPKKKNTKIVRIPGQDVITAALKEWREKQQERGERVALLPSNVQIRRIAASVPTTEQELAAVMRKWQFDLYGEELLNLIQPISKQWKDYIPKKQRKALNKK